MKRSSSGAQSSLLSSSPLLDLATPLPSHPRLLGGSLRSSLARPLATRRTVVAQAPASPSAPLAPPAAALCVGSRCCLPTAAMGCRVSSFSLPMLRTSDYTIQPTTAQRPLFIAPPHAAISTPVAAMTVAPLPAPIDLIRTLPAALLAHAVLPFLCFTKLMDVRSVCQQMQAASTDLAVDCVNLHFHSTPPLTLADAVWLRQRMAWLACRSYNVRALRAQGSGDGDSHFGLRCCMRDADLFGLGMADMRALIERCSAAAAGVYPFNVWPLTQVLTRALALHRSVAALRAVWLCRREAYKAYRLNEEVVRQRSARKEQLRAALLSVRLDLADMEWEEEEEVGWVGNVSFGRGVYWRHGWAGPETWMCRSCRPVSELMVLLHEALDTLGMRCAGTCTVDRSGCCMRQ